MAEELAKVREQLWEEEFALVYHMGKLSLEDVEQMHVQKRKWWLHRLKKQRQKENEEIRKQQAKARASRPSRRR